MTDSQLPFDHDGKSPSASKTSSMLNDPSYEEHDLSARPTTAPAVPPGFEGTVPTPKLGPQGSTDMTYHVRVALLEQELMYRNSQLDDTLRENARLSQLHRDETARVFELVRELQHCERRTAKADIAVEYFAELNVQMASKIKENQEPDGRVSALKDELQRSIHESQKALQVLEMKLHNLGLDNERLTSKLDCAMSTIIALSSIAISSRNSSSGKSITSPVADTLHHNNLIDLMDDCLTPTQQVPAEDSSTTLLDDIEGLEEYDMPPAVETFPSMSNSFDSDFSNSSYIVRFKGIRDMTKENASQWSYSGEKNIVFDMKVSTLDQKTPEDPSSPNHSSSDEYSAPSGEASPSCAHSNGNVNSSPTSKSPNTHDNRPGVFRPKLDILTDEDNSDKASSKEVFSRLQDKFGPRRKARSPKSPKLTSAKVFPMFKSKTEKERAIGLHQRDNSRNEKTDLPAFFKHGIQFHPGPESTEVYRTVLISNVPPIDDLFDMIRGGPVLDAKLLSTSTTTRSTSALVTFLEERAALAYRNYLSENHVFSCDFRRRVAVTVLTPTWPVKPEFRKRISDHKMSRCLEVQNFPKHISQRELKKDLQVCPDMTTTWVTLLQLNQAGLLKVHFSSILQASHAYQMFFSNKKYAACTVSYHPDPCAESLETLFETRPKVAKFIWTRHGPVAGENSTAYGKLVEEAQLETKDPSRNISGDDSQSQSPNNCGDFISVDEQSAEPERAIAAYVEQICEYTEASTVIDEIIEPSGSNRPESASIESTQPDITYDETSEPEFEPLCPSEKQHQYIAKMKDPAAEIAFVINISSFGHLISAFIQVDFAYQGLTHAPYVKKSDGR